MGPRLGPVAVILATLVLAAGCSGTAPVSESDAGDAADPGFGHVHGLALNPADGLVYAATHFGLFRLAEFQTADAGDTWTLLAATSVS